MSEELVNRLRDTNGGWASDEALAAADRIEALEAENARLRDALDMIYTHRAQCWAHDDSAGNPRRNFDKEDVILMERAARAALQDKGEA